MAFNAKCLDCMYCTCFGSNLKAYHNILKDPKTEKKVKDRIISEEFFCDYLCKTENMRPSFDPEKEDCPCFKKKDAEERKKMNRAYYLGVIRH